MRMNVTLKKDQQGWTVTHNGSRRAVRYPQVLRPLQLRETLGLQQSASVAPVLYRAMFTESEKEKLFSQYPQLFSPLTYHMGTRKYGPVCPYHTGYRSILSHPNTLTVDDGEYYRCPVCKAAIDKAVVTSDGRKIREVGK